jgi:hypothetical protein
METKRKKESGWTKWRDKDPRRQEATNAKSALAAQARILEKKRIVVDHLRKNP